MKIVLNDIEMRNRRKSFLRLAHFLRFMGVRNEFRYYRNKAMTEDSDFSTFFGRSLWECEDDEKLINVSFEWAVTLEKHDFWLQLNEAWIRYVRSEDLFPSEEDYNLIENLLDKTKRPVIVG